MPSTLIELASSMENYERLVTEIPVIEKTFPPITDKMMTLGNSIFYVLCNVKDLLRNLSKHYCWLTKLLMELFERKEP